MRSHCLACVVFPTNLILSYGYFALHLLPAISSTWYFSYHSICSIFFFTLNEEPRREREKWRAMYTQKRAPVYWGSCRISTFALLLSFIIFSSFFPLSAHKRNCFWRNAETVWIKWYYTNKNAKSEKKNVLIPNVWIIRRKGVRVGVCAVKLCAISVSMWYCVPTVTWLKP